jgi:hypothetical protein
MRHGKVVNRCLLETESGHVTRPGRDIAGDAFLLG